MATSMEPTKEAANTCRCEELNMEPSTKKQKICPRQELKPPQDTPHPANGKDVPDYSSDDYTGEEFDAYFQSVEDSRGYDVLDFPPCGIIYSTILPVAESDLEKHYEFYKGLAQFAIDENNKNEKKNYELEKVVKVNFLLAQGSTYYFTLKVKNKDHADQKSCICRAAVYVALDQSLNLSELFEDPKFEFVLLIRLINKKSKEREETSNLLRKLRSTGETEKKWWYKARILLLAKEIYRMLEML